MIGCIDLVNVLSNVFVMAWLHLFARGRCASRHCYGNSITSTICDCANLYLKAQRAVLSLHSLSMPARNKIRKRRWKCTMIWRCPDCLTERKCTIYGTKRSDLRIDILEETCDKKEIHRDNTDVTMLIREWYIYEGTKLHSFQIM